jgi:hypothetical protein
MKTSVGFGTVLISMREVSVMIEKQQALFAALFAGRQDAHGSGGDRPHVLHQPPDWSGHLLQGKPIGIFPLMDDRRVNWGCIDIDEDDIGLAFNTWQVLKAQGLTSWVERSRSKGYHVWVFASDSVPAEVMRLALLVSSQVLSDDRLSSEVNPKNPNAQGLGNWVRLPYPHGATFHQTVLAMHEDREPLSVGAFIALAYSSRNSPQSIMSAAQMYRHPVKEAGPGPASSGSITNPDRYLESALRGEFEAIAGTSKGGRNHQLYISSLKLGRFISQGHNQGPIEDVLLRAASGCGLVAEDGESAVMQTIRSGLRNGATRSR